MTIENTVQEIPMKFFVVRNNETVEVRRRCLVCPDYNVVAKVVSEFARGDYRIQYLDDVDDLVTMSSQVEWEECLRVWDSSSVLKLRIELPSVPSFRRSRCRSSSGERGRCRSRSPDVQNERKCMQSLWRKSNWIDELTESAPKQQCTNCDQLAKPFSRYCCKMCWQGRGHGTQVTFEPAAESATEQTGKLTEGPLDGGKCRKRQVGQKCVRCDNQTTGVVPAFCCGMCRAGKGKHGPLCQQIAFVTKEGADTSCMKGKIGLKCASCDYQTTGVVPAFCCGVCRSGKGKHGPRCQQVTLFAPKEEAAETSENTESATDTPKKAEKCMKKGKIGLKCVSCDYQTTGVVAEHCCGACRSGKGKHGPRCQQVTFVPKADVAGTSENTDSAGDTLKKVEKCMKGKIGLKCVGCDYQTTGVVAEHCCGACRAGKGKHGPRCQQVALVPNEAVRVVEEKVQSVDDEVHEVHPNAVLMLKAMGFDVTDAVRAELSACNGNVSAVLEKLN